MWFKVDYNKLVILLQPTFLRGKVIIGFLQCLVAPVITVYDSWIKKRTDQNYRLAHNGQVCYLRKVLNDSFDPVLRRISITDGQTYDREYIYTRGEQKPRYLGVIYLRPRSDYESDGINFRVLVPVGFNLDAVIHKMIATIELYKLAGKRYKIQYDE